MNTLVKAIVLSVSTALIASTAMAAPQHQAYNDHPAKPQPHQQQSHQKYQDNRNQHVNQKQNQQHKSASHKRTDPSRDWKVGQKVPAQYHGQSYKVNHSKYKKLSKPGRNQEWIKVNNDYVLTNTITHVILKIING